MFETKTDYKWSTKVYKLSNFLDCFQLPQTVKVVEVVLDKEKENEAVSIDDVLIFHNHEETFKIRATDTSGEVLSLPMDCETKVLRVAPEFAQSRLSGRDILQCLSKVLFLRILEDDAENGLKRNEKLKINYDSVENHGVSYSFVLESITSQTKTVKITQDSATKFQPILDPVNYSFFEIVKKFGLPQHIIQTSSHESERSSNGFGEEKERLFKLESTFRECYVNVSNVQDPDTYFRLETNLELLFSPTWEAEEKALKDYKTAKTTIFIIAQRARVSDKALYEDMSSSRFSEMSSMDEPPSPNDKQRHDFNRCANSYTPTPSAKAMQTFYRNLVLDPYQQQRKSVYDIPKQILQQQLAEGWNEQSPNWYNVPQPLKKEVTANNGHEREHAQLSQLKQADDEDDDPIYQEIDFRELPEEKSTKCSTLVPKSEPQTSENIREIVPRGSSNRKSTRYVSRNNSVRNYVNVNIGDNFRLEIEDSEITKEQEEAIQTQERKEVYKSGKVPYNRRFSAEYSLFSAKESTSMWSPQNNLSTSQHRQSVGCLEETILGNSIAESLIKNRIFAAKTVKMEDDRPPLPPPRSSSIKPADNSLCVPRNFPKQIAQPLDEHSSSKDTKPKAESSNHRKGQHLPQASNAKYHRELYINREGKSPQNRPLVEPRKDKDRPTFLRSKTEHHIATNKATTSKSTVKPFFKTKQETLPKDKWSPTNRKGADCQTTHAKTTESNEHRPFRTLPRNKPSKQDAVAISDELQSLVLSGISKKVVDCQTTPPKTLESNEQRPFRTLPRSKPSKDDTIVIPDNLEVLSVSEVGKCLEKLNLASLVEYFKDNLIDGEMLLALDEDTMVEMGIEKFHRLKLKKFINGWRPSL